MESTWKPPASCKSLLPSRCSAPKFGRCWISASIKHSAFSQLNILFCVRFQSVGNCASNSKPISVHLFISVISGKVLWWRLRYSLVTECGRLITECFQDLFRRTVVAEGLADVDEMIHVARPEHKRSSKLQGIFAQLVLAVAAGFGPFACRDVIAAQQVQ